MTTEELNEAKELLKALNSKDWYMGNTTDEARDFIIELGDYCDYMDDYLLDEMAKREAEEGGASRVWHFLNGIDSFNDSLGYTLDGYGNARNVTIDDLRYDLEEIIKNN